MSADPVQQPYAEHVAALRRLQDGVVSRAQLLGAGCAPHDVERMLRRGELVVALPGAYVDHNGPRTWNQRAWVAVLACWPAALAGASAMRAEGGPGLRGFDESAAIEVAVAVERTVVVRPGVRVRRMAGLDDRVRWNASPPRVRYEEAVLERGYLRRVERAHALPSAERQQPGRVDGSRIYRDAPYPAYGVVVELDGRLDHTALTDRDRDLDRDRDPEVAATAGAVTVRLGWGQVHERPCRTAKRVAALLVRGGWGGTPEPCSPGCVVGL